MEASVTQHCGVSGQGKAEADGGDVPESLIRVKSVMFLGILRICRPLEFSRSEILLNSGMEPEIPLKHQCRKKIKERRSLSIKWCGMLLSGAGSEGLCWALFRNPTSY